MSFGCWRGRLRCARQAFDTVVECVVQHGPRGLSRRRGAQRPLARDLRPGSAEGVHRLAARRGASTVQSSLDDARGGLLDHGSKRETPDAQDGRPEAVRANRALPGRAAPALHGGVPGLQDRPPLHGPAGRIGRLRPRAPDPALGGAAGDRHRAAPPAADRRARLALLVLQPLLHGDDVALLRLLPGGDLCAPARYRFLRRVFLCSMLLALPWFYLYPLAPPRFMAEYGYPFIDSQAVYGPNYFSGRSPVQANQFAAMPSMHCGWTVIGARCWPHALPRRKTRSDPRGGLRGGDVLDRGRDRASLPAGHRRRVGHGRRGVLAGLDASA